MDYKINIIQGNNKQIPSSDINIVIDVIRAFSVSHQAFLNGIEKIMLTNSEEIALKLKNSSSNIILAGEVDAIKIDSFDFGNSPYDISHANLKNKTLIQKTTNGVKATLNALNTDSLFVTGYSNAYTTAIHVKNLLDKPKYKQTIQINIIASHPTGDDDLACAQYIKQIIENKVSSLKDIEESTVNRIMYSDAANKFYDQNNQSFSILDLSLCLIKIKSDFIMKVEEFNKEILIRKLIIN